MKWEHHIAERKEEAGHWMVGSKACGGGGGVWVWPGRPRCSEQTGCPVKIDITDRKGAMKMGGRLVQARVDGSAWKPARRGRQQGPWEGDVEPRGVWGGAYWAGWGAEGKPPGERGVGGAGP